MKRIICTILSICVFLIMLVGCGNESTIPTHSSKSTDFDMSNTALDLSNTSDIVSGEDIPDNIMQIWEQYKKIEEENHLSYEAQEPYKDEYWNEWKDGGYIISISSKTKMWIHSDNKITTTLDTRNTNIIRDYITATLMIFDSDNDFSTATDKMQKMINSYSSEKVSDTITCGDYVFGIFPDDISGDTELKGIYKPSWTKIKQDLFKKVDFETYNAPTLNKDVKVKVSGKIVKFTPPDTLYNIASVIVEEKDGKEYLCQYNFGERPFSYNPNTICEVYGCISTTKSNKPCIQTFSIVMK